MNGRLVEKLRPVVDEHGNIIGVRPPRRFGHLLRFVWLAAIVVIVVLTVFLGIIQKWLWMRQLDYAGIFWTLLSVRWAMFGAAFVFGFLYLWINLRFAARSIDTSHAGSFLDKFVDPNAASNRKINFDVNPRFVSLAISTVSAAIALMFALGISAQWDLYLRFRYGGSFGLSDPLFRVDLGFYLFRLPFYELVQSSITFLTFFALAIAFCLHVFFRPPQLGRGSRFDIQGKTAKHFSVLLLILTANWGWSFYLSHYDLVYSTLGIVYGAGYTAAHVTRVALWIMMGVSALGCIFLALNFFRPRFTAVIVGIGIYAVLYIVGVVALPALFQQFVVQPSELSLETPYLKNYIEFTRKAYKLDTIQETAYPSLTDLTPEIISRNQDTIQNIRLWDKRPLLQTYQQTQAIRLYYQFYNVDVDRYDLADGYHQVMLATRELSAELPSDAQTWVNQYLQFTHGYGLVMNSVSNSINGGFPQYLLENVPPESKFGLNITQPGIYYGEVSPGYKIVATGIKEFDYPKGNENVYTSYQGKGGIPLDSLWKRLLFAWTQKDINILLTSYLRPQSRIQIWRSVQERVSQIAPFLLLDKDPYAVLSKGKLYWIQDAYTVSDHFPYSSPLANGPAQGMNYIRNSVKIVVDMYDGTVSFYVMDPKDPVLDVYRRAFPGVFRNIKEMSADLKSHLRYPEDLFTIQAAQYQTFHMTDPQVFYNREDLWMPPQEKFDGQLTPMDPHYILMKLPGSTKLEYLLMTPFTPQNRDNMIAWMAAKCDLPDYGKILVYQLPKEKLTYGPNQISAMIDQNPTISQQLTLWDQKGSAVIRGRLIVIPIENSFLYVVPVYLKAEGTNFPQLKRIIVATGDKVVMEPTLDEAMSAMFGTQSSGPSAFEIQPSAISASGMQPSLSKAELDEARAQLAAAQKAIDSLKRLLASPAK
ncbi:MAG TPA: UPF0182 family protein [Acidobacteriaceae bacterium]|jgi:hypothetical protein|nr:UPF0182 family protein [Acidobacteriaceae bacterium]